MSDLPTRLADRLAHLRRLEWVRVGTIVRIAVLSTLAVGAFAGVALAGDEPAAIAAEPETLEAEPGDELEVDIHLASHGGWGPEAGLESVRLLALTQPDYLEVLEIETAAWLEDGEETTLEGSTSVDEARGIAEAHQYRDPPNGGATGEGVFGTLTLRVAEDVPAANATVGFEESQIMLADGNPLPVYDQPLTVVIDGGGEEADAGEHGDLSAFGAADEHAATGQGPEEPETPPELEESDDSAVATEPAQRFGWSHLAVGVLASLAVGVTLVVWRHRYPNR